MQLGRRMRHQAHRRLGETKDNNHWEWAWIFPYFSWKLNQIPPYFSYHKWHWADKFLNRIKDTCFPGHSDPLFDHIEQIPQILISSCKPFNMISHSDDQNWTACLIITTKPVFPRSMYFLNNLFFFRDEIRPVILIPLNPIPPHLNDLFFLELPRNTKTC